MLRPIALVCTVLLASSTAHAGDASLGVSDIRIVLIEDDGDRTRIDSVGTWFDLGTGDIVLVRQTPDSADALDTWAASGDDTSYDVRLIVTGTDEATKIYDVSIDELEESSSGQQMIRLSGSTTASTSWDISDSGAM